MALVDTKTKQCVLELLFEMIPETKIVSTMGSDSEVCTSEADKDNFWGSLQAKHGTPKVEISQHQLEDQQGMQ